MRRARRGTVDTMGDRGQHQEEQGSKRERAEVRRHVLFDGGNVDDVAAALRRRWDLRPRRAYRHACGWTQDEVAVRFTEVAARLTGLRSAPVAGGRISEYERWPNQGRQPTPYVLIVLAEVYGTDPDSLVDRSDTEAMPEQDEIVLDALRRMRTRAAGTAGTAV